MVTDTRMLRNRRAFVALIGMLILCSNIGRARAEDSTLVRVLTRRAKSHVGVLIKSDNDGVRLYDIKIDAEVSIPKRDILRLIQPLSDDDAARAIGLPLFFAWQISKLPASKTKTGKIAKVTPTAVYFTLSKKQIEVGQKLSVYRRKGEIIDPDTGKVLAFERPRIAELEVTEVSEAFSKGKLVGDLEIELVAGDEVELPGAGERRIAVCPIYSATGELTNVGVGLSEDLMTRLVKRKIKVVERTAINDVLTELVEQNTILFDPKSAQKLGRLTGASHVVVGKIVRTGKLGKAYIRLVEVESGEILQAATSSVSLVNARVIHGNSVSSTSGKSSKNVVKFAPGHGHEGRFASTKRGTQIISDRPYSLLTVPQSLTGGTMLIRNSSSWTRWLSSGILIANKDCQCYIAILTSNGRTKKVAANLNESMTQLGWTSEKKFQTTSPDREQWVWSLFSRDIEAGPVSLPSPGGGFSIASIYLFTD